ncbi:HD-GYP domain-containing protein [Massilia sp. SR12]
MYKRITIDQVRRGMFVHKLCGSWLNNPFWATSFALDSNEMVQQVLVSGVKELWIDLSKGADVASSVNTRNSVSALETGPAVVPAHFQFSEVHPTSFVDELKVASQLIKQSHQAVTSMFTNARMGRLQDFGAVRPLVEELASSVLRNPNALISLVRLKQADDYTYMHSVAVSAMMVALGKQIGLADEKLRDCGLAGLLHDIGKMAIPADILNKPGKLTDAEFLIVKNHPTAGHEMLTVEGNVPGIALDVCLHHHEKYDGTGYPAGLKNEEISLYSRMGAICDVYDAITSNRPYKTGWCPAESLQRMAEWTKTGHFDPTLFAAFVKCIGIFPVGTLVKLKSGRLGVVIDNSKSLLRPQVRVFFSTKSMSYIPPLTVDLAIGGAMDSIAGREDIEKWGFPDLGHYWQNPA